MDTTFWQRMAGIRLRRRLRPEVALTIDGLRVRIDVRDGVIGYALYMQRTWEPEVGRFIDCLDLASGVAVDVGANIGWHTMTLSRAVGASGRVFAFEPDPHNYALLLANLAANHMTNVSPQRTAIGERSGECLLCLNPWNFGDHRVVNGKLGTDLKHISVPMTTLDSALDAIAPGTIRLIKVDVQGYDLQVLDGMQETLRRNPAVVLLLEVSGALLKESGASGREYVDRLRALGFDGFEIQEHRLLPMLAAESYSYMDEHADVNVALSRRADELGVILRKLYSSRQGVVP
jgi:FkbM family methyltransferase